MIPCRWLLPLCLPALAGCALRAGASRPPAEGAAWGGARVGPSLERLCERMQDRALPAAERRRYWEGVRGRLVRATGSVVEASDWLLLSCPVGKRGRVVCVLVYPEAGAAAALPWLRKGQRLAALGLIDRPAPDAPAGACPPEFVLREARLLAK